MMMRKSMKMKIIIGADHAGFRLKENVKSWLVRSGHEVLDVGAKKLDRSDDYPDFAAKAASKVSEDRASLGLLFCGSAEGMCIAANKVKGVRAVAVRSKALARLSRLHNDANVLCLPGGDTVYKQSGMGLEKAKGIISVWLNTQFSGEQRHRRRIEKIGKIGKGRV